MPQVKICQILIPKFIGDYDKVNSESNNKDWRLSKKWKQQNLPRTLVLIVKWKQRSMLVHTFWQDNVATKTMDSMRLSCVLVLLIVSLVKHPALAVGGGGVLRCDFPAIYNFGDSNSDTGGISAALSEIHAPNGETFFGHPSGRACDGRLIINFIGN